MSTLRTLALGVMGTLVAASPLLGAPRLAGRSNHADHGHGNRDRVYVGRSARDDRARRPGQRDRRKMEGRRLEQEEHGGQRLGQEHVEARGVITGIGFRFKDGSHAAQLQKIVMANGKEMSLYGQLRVLPAAER